MEARGRASGSKFIIAMGNINPLGITGTPVIDPATGDLFRSRGGAERTSP